MRSDEWERTSAAAVAATREVFSEFGAPLSHTRRALYGRAGWTKVALISFAGDSLRGMLALRVDSSLLERTLPLPSGSMDDWQCELSNLVLGRFKRELLALGLPIFLGTPLIVVGTDIWLDTTAVSALVLTFTSQVGESLDLVLDATAESSARVVETSAIFADSGDILLF